jgi:hypothetical protein
MARCTWYNNMWLAEGQWFSPGTPISSTNKTDRHDKAELFFKLVLNTTPLTHNEKAHTISFSTDNF